MPLILVPAYLKAGPAADPYISYVSLLAHMNDFSEVKGKVLTKFGTPQILSTQKKFGSASLYLDGPSYLQVANSADLNFGTGDFTVEFWMNPTDLVSNVGQEMISKGNGLQIYRYGNTLAVALSAANSGSYFINATAIVALPPNQWAHIALVRFSNRYDFYVNGVLYGLGTSTSAISTGTDPLIIGGYKTGSTFSYGFTGYLDEVRITKGVARYTSAFTAPIAAFSDI